MNESGKGGSATPAFDAEKSNVDADSEWGPSDGLVFRWRAKRGYAFALTFFVVVAGLLHAIGFYLFQVVPPLSGRIEAQPAKVTILDAEDPKTSAMLREIDDRLVFLRPASLSSSSRLRIENFAVTFSPSFMRHRVPFRQPGVKEQVTPLLGELLPRDGLVLPPVEAAEPSIENPVKLDVVRRWSLTGDVADRALSDGVLEQLENALPQLETGPGVSYQIWADASGKVVNALILQGMEQPLQDDVLALIRAQLRFQASPGDSLQTGVFRLER